MGAITVHREHDMNILSLDVFYLKTLPSIHTRQWRVLKVIKELCDTAHGPPTAYEVARQLGYSDPNRVRPRISELANDDEGDPILLPAGIRACRVTGTLAHTWRTNPAYHAYIRDMGGADV